MCLAMPMKITALEPDRHGRVESSGLSFRVNLKLIPDARVGDFVIVHAGFAIEKLDQVEAERNLAIFEELARGMERT